MKKITLIILIFFLMNSVYGQLIDRKLNLYGSFGISKSFGKKNINENGFISPSLFNNFKVGLNFKIKAAYKLSPNFSVCSQLKKTGFSNWESTNSISLYENSKSKIQSIGFGIIVHTKYRKVGIFNKLSASIIAIPTYNRVNVKLSKAIFEIRPEELQDDLLNSKISTIGTDIYLNLEYSITQKYAVFAESGISYFPLKSQLYNDKRFLSFNANIGFCLKLMKDKHFYYN